MSETAETIQKLMRKMSAVQWSWAAGEVSRLMGELGAELLEDVGERKTYRSAEGPAIDVYLDEGEIVAVEALLDLFSFDDPDELDPDDYELQLDEFAVKFANAVAACREVAGNPAFQGSYDDPGYPSDQDALSVALWPVENGRIMVEVKHEDREVPIRLLLAAAPPEEEEDDDEEEEDE